MLVFSERDIAAKPGEVAAALDGADVFFGSLLFDYDQARPWCLFGSQVSHMEPYGIQQQYFVVFMMPAL